jgi:hypothetical protein
MDLAEKMSGGSPGGPMATQSISPETTYNTFFSTLTCVTIKHVFPCLLVGCNVVEGVVGELQKMWSTDLAPCKWNDYLVRHSAHKKTRYFNFNKAVFILFEVVASSVWLPRSLQQGVIFGTFQNLQTDPARS